MEALSRTAAHQGVAAAVKGQTASDSSLDRSIVARQVQRASFGFDASDKFSGTQIQQQRPRLALRRLDAAT